MIGVVVVTHGQLATELLNAAETIVGDLPRFAAVSIGWHEDTEDARDEIAQAIGACRGGRRRADPHRHVRRHGVEPGDEFLSPGKVEVITGVNLPMLIKLANCPSNRICSQSAREMREHGRNAIWVASDLLRGEKT